MRNVIFKVGISITLLIVFQSCYYDIEEELYPAGTACDTVNVTYSGSVALILDQKCNSCHSGAFPEAGLKTDNYNDLKILVDNGSLWGTVNHISGYDPMPKNKPKMNDCDLSKIRIWIDKGALDD